MPDGSMITEIGSIVAIIGVGGGLWWQGRNARDKAEDKAEARAKAVTDSIAANQRSIEDRMTKFEHATDVRFRAVEAKQAEHDAQFVPRDQIMAEFRHERVNRESAENSLLRMHETLAAQVRDTTASVIRVTEQATLLNSSMGEVKDTIKEFQRWMTDKLEKIQSAIVTRS